MSKKMMDLSLNELLKMEKDLRGKIREFRFGKALDGRFVHAEYIRDRKSLSRLLTVLTSKRAGGSQ